MGAKVLLFALPALMAYAAASDLITMKIPNRISLILVAGFPLAALASGLSPALVALHVAAAAGVLALTFGLFALGWIGGGDAKLAAATSLWLGLGTTPAYLTSVALWGGVLTLLFLAMRAVPLPKAALAQPWVARLHDRTTGIPYGIALALGAWLVYPQSEIYAALVAR